MTRYSAFLASVIVAFALAVPPAVEAQAQRRGGSDSGSSSGSRGGDGGTAAPRSAPAPAPPPPTTREPSQPSRPSGAAARPSGGRTSGAGSSDERSSSGVSSGARARTVQPARGVAQPRANAPVPPRPPRDRWDGWSPWYGYGAGYSYGYPYSYGYWGYNPWIYTGYWGRYGWYDPFLYDPFAFGYAAPYYWGGSSSNRDVERDERGPVGSIRLRVNPEHARVYVDGALVGTAGEFGGLANHLELPAGAHELELRADGYQTWSGQVTVRDNRTRTERVNLKKQ